MGADMNSRTVEGLLAYCDWLAEKGYATGAQIDPWKTAVNKVFDTVEGEGYGALDLSTLDLDDYLSRFQTLAGRQYKAESIVTYGRRLRNAIDAQVHYLETGRPPTFKRGGSRPKHDGATTEATQKKSARTKQSGATPSPTPYAGLVEFPFPLRNGQMAQLRLPARLEKSDADRLAVFLRALQFDQQAQIPEHTGEGALAA